MPHDMPAEFFGFAGNADSVASLVGQVSQVFAYGCITAAGFELARKHSENQIPVLAHDAGGQPELLND